MASLFLSPKKKKKAQIAPGERTPARLGFRRFGSQQNDSRSLAGGEPPPSPCFGASWSLSPVQTSLGEQRQHVPFFEVKVVREQG